MQSDGLFALLAPLPAGVIADLSTLPSLTLALSHSFSLPPAGLLELFFFCVFVFSLGTPGLPRHHDAPAVRAPPPRRLAPGGRPDGSGLLHVGGALPEVCPRAALGGGTVVVDLPQDAAAGRVVVASSLEAAILRLIIPLSVLGLILGPSRTSTSATPARASCVSSSGGLATAFYDAGAP